MSRPPFRSFVEISRDQVARNYRNVCDAVGPSVEVLGVVKADAYGHGAVEISKLLAAQGANWLAVSSVDEAVTLRCAGLRTRILVMAGLLPFERDAVIEYDLTPTVHSLEDIEAVDQLAKISGKPLNYHLKIDSGMARMGTRAGAGEIARAVTAAGHARLEGLMTHFASAADYSSLQTDLQLRVFHEMVEYLAGSGVSPRYIHMSSTNAIGYGRREAWYNLVRAGHALYGYLSPARGDAPSPVIDVKPALTWKARILNIKDIPAGTLVGYGGSFQAPEPMRIAIVGAGYADGVFHRLSNRGKVIAAGKLTPILGTVSMDLTTIDISHAPHLRPGDEITLLGTEGKVTLDAQQIARTAGTISYNILCGISARVRRVYL